MDAPLVACHRCAARASPRFSAPTTHTFFLELTVPSGSISCPRRPMPRPYHTAPTYGISRSEEHTSELQSRLHLVCRLLLEKKKKNKTKTQIKTQHTPPHT